MTRRIDRRAPLDGYDFGNKRQYRRSVWACFRREFGGHVADKSALLMPSVEADEVDVAVGNGFKPSNLFAVDKNPAIAATIRRKHPLLGRSLGCSAGKACFRLADESVELDALNLDFTGNVSEAYLDEVTAVSVSGALSANAFVAVTMLRGRESDWVLRKTTVSRIVSSVGRREMYWDMPTNDMKRLLRIAQCFELSGRSAMLVSSSAYKSTSGHQTMLWAVFAVHDYGCQCKHCGSVDWAQKRRFAFRIRGGWVICTVDQSLSKEKFEEVRGYMLRVSGDNLPASKDGGMRRV